MATILVSMLTYPPLGSTQKTLFLKGNLWSGSQEGIEQKLSIFEPFLNPSVLFQSQWHVTTGTFGLKRSRFKPSRAGSCWLFGGSCDYPWLQINDECIVIHTGKNSRDDAREICGTNMFVLCGVHRVKKARQGKKEGLFESRFAHLSALSPFALVMVGWCLKIGSEPPMLGVP